MFPLQIIKLSDIMWKHLLHYHLPRNFHFEDQRMQTWLSRITCKLYIYTYKILFFKCYGVLYIKCCQHVIMT